MGKLLRRTFNCLLWLSIALAIGTGILWALSYRHGFHFTHVTSAGTFSIRSASGQFIIGGPPTDGAEDEVARQIAARMSNDDFTWNAPIEKRDGWLMEGEAKSGTATWEMFQRYKNKPRELAGMEPAQRIWMKTLDDPKRYLSAHLMLLLFTKQWHESAAWNDVPELILSSKAGATKPELPEWKATRKRWHDRLDVDVHAVPFAAIAGITLFVPFIWLMQPRWQRKSAWRWAFSSLSAISLLLCIASGFMWIRSNTIRESWRFADRPAGSFSLEGDNVFTFHQRWIGSGRGKVTFSRTTTVDAHHHRAWKRDLFGYQRGYPSIASFMRSTGERRWLRAGVEYYAAPFGAEDYFPDYVNRDLVSRNGYSWVPTPTMRFSNVLSMWGGYRVIVISWWMITAAWGFLPLIWFASSTRSFVRHRRYMNRQRSGLCPACGYDLCGSPDRCPECGAEAKAEAIAVE
jgi:hypothetical protein